MIAYFLSHIKTYVQLICDYVNKTNTTIKNSCNNTLRFRKEKNNIHYSHYKIVVAHEASYFLQEYVLNWNYQCRIKIGLVMDKNNKSTTAPYSMQLMSNPESLI